MSKPREKPLLLDQTGEVAPFRIFPAILRARIHYFERSFGAFLFAQGAKFLPLQAFELRSDAAPILDPKPHLFFFRKRFRETPVHL